jgi:N-acetylneuraminic acid mutarotase
VSGAVYVYDPASSTWSARARKPTPVSNLGAAEIAGMFYAVGGCTTGSSVSDALEVYDPAADAWARLDPLPAPRCAHAVAAVDGRLYVFGGWNGSRYVADVWVYDPATGVWSEGSPMPVARGFLGVAALNGRVYVVGGYDGHREYALAHRYDPAADARGEPAWQELPAMTEARGGLGLAAEGGAVYAMGGGWRGDLEYNERFDPLSNTWSRLDSPFEAQWRNPGVAALAARVYVAGGWSGDYLNVVTAYQSSFRSFLPLGSRGSTP